MGIVFEGNSIGSNQKMNLKGKFMVWKTKILFSDLKLEWNDRIFESKVREKKQQWLDALPL